MGNRHKKSSRDLPGRHPSGSGERRSAHRYEAVEDAVRLGWWEDQKFAHRPALLLNVSQSGALLLADRLPPKGKARSVWICLDGPSPTDWVEAKVVGVKKSWLGPHRLRLAFVGTCPYRLFSATVYGPEVQVAPPESVTPGFEERDWR